MKVLFLTALIIAYANAAALVPSLLLGTWKFDFALGNCSSFDPCIDTVDFATGEDATINMNIVGSCSASYVMQNIVADENWYSGSTSFTMTPTDNSSNYWTATMTNTNGLALNLEPVYPDCEITLIKGGIIIKATIVAVIIAIAILFL